MDFKSTSKKITRFIARQALVGCSLIIGVLPHRFIYVFARSFGGFFCLFSLKHRKTAFESLRIAFGREKSEAELKRIVKDCFIGIAKSGVEMLALIKDPQSISEKVTLQGKEYLDAALAQGRGVVLVSAHFGNFPLLITKLALEGYKISVIMRKMRDERTEDFIMRKRSSFGLKIIHSQPRQECVSLTLRALRNNEIVFIPMDQNFGTAGVYVDFFGKKAGTATGPVIFAQRTKAVVVPCFICRADDNSHKIIFEAPLTLTAGKDGLVKDVQLITGVIEKYIRRYPAEWGWIHRRWKSRPIEERQPAGV